MALFDTGARRTCITGAVVDALMVAPSREGFKMNTAAGLYPHEPLQAAGGSVRR